MPIARATARMLVCALLALCCAPHLDTTATPAPRSPGNGLRIVGPRGETTPVVNEGGKLALEVVDASGNDVAVTSWSSDNKAVGKVSRRGQLKGKAFGFAAVTAQTARGPVSGFIVVARVRRQGGAMVRGDTKADTGGNVYLSSPSQHVVYRSDGLSANVFAGASGQGGYVEGAGAQARFDGPAGLGVDNQAEGGVYVADTANHCIRKVDFRGRSSLAVGTPRLAGTMVADETPMAEVVMSAPRGVASVGANLFVTDTENHCVWYVDTQRQRVELVAGDPGESGLVNGVGRGARLNRPSGIAVNTRGNLLAIADTGNNVIRLVGITPREGGGVIGEVTTLGLSSSAREIRIAAKLRDDRGEDQITFDGPESVSFDGVDNVYVIDQQTASVVTRGRDFVERVELAQFGTLGDPASVTVRRTQAFVLDEAATSEAQAVSVVEIGAPRILAVSPDSDDLAGGELVRITGVNFAPESRLTLGDAEVTDFTVARSTQITFTVPPQMAPGGRTLTVATRGGVAQFRFGIRAVSFDEISAGEITTFAGGLPYIGDGGLALDPDVSVSPQDVAVAASGDLVIVDGARNRVRRFNATTGTITTLAGNGQSGFGGDGGPATSASLKMPSSVALDAAGNVFIADGGNGRVRRVDAVSGIITTVVGGGPFGPRADGIPATSANLLTPAGVALDAAGNLFVVDSFAQSVHRVDAATGIIRIVAGSGTRQVGYNGDGIPGRMALLTVPNGVAVDAGGNVFIADTYNQRVRRVDARTGIISTVAGAGTGGFGGDGGPATSASLLLPFGVAVDVTGDLLVADTFNYRVRRVDASTGVIRTVAGDGDPVYDGDGGPATAANFGTTVGVVVGAGGHLFVSDSGNARVRRVDAETGIVTTVAGGGVPGIADNGPATRANLSEPLGLSFDADGNLLIADSGNGRIRRVDRQGIITAFAGNGSFGYSGEGVPARSSALSSPVDVAVGPGGTFFIADLIDHRIRRVGSDGIMTTAVGTGVAAYNGDGIPAASAALNFPYAVAVDGAGNLFVGDGVNARIRRVDAATGRITTVAGTGQFGNMGDGGPATAAGINLVTGIAIDTAGNLFLAETVGYRVRRVDAASGIITTVAGGIGQKGFAGDGGAATAARFEYVTAVALDGAGNLFIADRDTNRIRRVDAVTGIITTVVGGDQSAYSGDGGPATSARLAGPHGVAVDRDGNLFIADTFNDSIRVVKGIAAPRP